MDERDPFFRPPFQYSNLTHSFDPVIEATKLGTYAAVRLAGLYAIALAGFILLGEGRLLDRVIIQDFASLKSVEFNILMGTLYLGGLLWLTAIIPVFIMGAVGGCAIGWTFQFIKTPLSIGQVLHYGFWLSLLLLVSRIGIFGGFEYFVDNINDPTTEAVWVYPNVIAFFGFWWITHKVNSKMPSS